MAQKSELIDKFMADLGEAGQGAKITMEEQQEKFKVAIEALKDLSSNDLTDLIETEETAELRHTMNAVMILLGRDQGWK